MYEKNRKVGDIIYKITKEDEAFPNSLRMIKNPPKQLFLEGNIDLLNKNVISIIGSRSCTERGEKIASKFAMELSKQGLVIASGMAIGIDSAAHRGTLEVEGKTIAVLGSGFKNIFPSENIDLFNEIINNKGLIITEYEPNVEPSSNRFLERNRIVSGLAIGILVVEAAHRSGTSVTAKLAKEQGKKIFVVPHEIGDIHGVGTNRLIRNGAILVTSSKEIIEEFDFLEYIKPKIKKAETKVKTKKKRNTIDKKLENTKSKININQIQNCRENNFEKRKVKKEYQEIYDLIFNGFNSIDTLCNKSKNKVSEINKILFMLELDGAIVKQAGGYKCI